MNFWALCTISAHLNVIAKHPCDIVCNGRLDIGDLVVEQNETDDEEER